MTARTALRAGVGTARAAVGRARRYGTGVGVRVQRGLRADSRLVPGLLSVVVPCYNVEDYLDECLVSLRFQHYRRVEIIVVDDGSPDRSYDIAKAHQRRDPRVRVVRRPNGGLSAARNTGVEHARGEFLTFIDSDDVVQPEAFSAPLRALGQSGSDFAVTYYDRLDRGMRRRADKHIRRAHLRRRLATTLGEFPEAMVNAVAWSKTYRRTFWDAAGLEFPVGKLYEDQPVSMAAYARARTFDVLPEIGVSWRIRHDRSSISQASNTLTNLEAHTEAVHASLEALRDGGHQAAAEQRALQVLANNMPFFVRHVLRADDAYWKRLAQAIGELVEAIPADLYARRVASYDKMLYEFVIHQRREDLREFLSSYGTDTRRFRVTIEPDGVHCQHPVSDRVDPRVTVMSDAQLELVARALRVGLADDGRLRVEGWAFIRNIDLAAHDLELDLALVGPDGERLPVEVEMRPEPWTDLQGEHYHCDYRRGGFVATFDTGSLAAGSGPWELSATLEVTAGGLSVTRQGPVVDTRPDGSAGIVRVLRRPDGQQVWVDAFRRPLSVTVGAPPDLGPAIDPATIASPRPVPAQPAYPEAIGWTLTDEIFELRIDGIPAGERWRAIMHVGDLARPSIAVPGTWRRDGDLAIATFPLTRSHWGRDGVPLPAHKYAFHVISPSGRTMPLRTGARLLDTLPVDQPLLDHRATVTTFPGPPQSLSLRLRPPLRADELGLRNQHRLREQYTDARADRNVVFFRSLYGEVTNCNGLGVHTELRERGADLELIWSVADRSVPVPAGAVGLVEETAEWHEAIARARYHMVNVHQLEWFIKPEGQVMIQTMHGYPYKIMGHDWWTKGRFPIAQVATFDRRARDWDYFVSPATYATPLLSRAFLEPAAAEAEILEIGYPRNDVLVSAEAEHIRERTRRLLGVRSDQTVVMYAPTFRDYLSADDMTAQNVEFFDEQAAARALGDDFVILMRGHAFNARTTQRRASGGRVVDVTDHPDINDLILASDVAVLDYSSLRFDYALTGRPMIFLVPDLADYDAARGGVIDYAPTAPGPHVTTTQEVVAWLRTPERLAAHSTPLIEEFRARYVDLDDGHASARLVDAVFVPRGDAPKR